MRNNPSASQIYICDDNHSYIIRILVSLKTEISYDALRYAVDTAIKRYPYLAIKIEHEPDESELIFVHNNNEIPIFDHIGDVTLASDETNYHILALSYSDKTICFDICHGFADGVTITEWIKTVVYYYICKITMSSLDKTDIKTVDDEITDEELLDPIKPYVDKLLSSPIDEVPPPPAQESSRIKDYYQITPDSKNVRFWVDSKKFMNFAKCNDGTPTSFVIALLSKLLHEKNSNVELPIIVGIAKDLRAGLNVKLSHHPTILPFFITFPQRALNHNIETLSTMARGKFILMQDDEGLKELVNAFTMSCATTLSLPNIESKRQFNSAFMDGLNETDTFAISYTGKKSFGVVEEYIDKIYPLVTNDAADLMIEIFSIGNKLCFSFMQAFKEDTLVHDFILLLEENGVDVHDFEFEELHYPKVKI